ncbi:hypothetical protein L226DRAFT_539315 [Lentinus tigrinus ALCF2SS1-7]|uniref:uncharacterized protein n=1 Tax=Lentinus tigrinus ALCF2SS1-7 TaxID=1328758 RepID=UPI001165F0D4|nr:hypothetical protein L226DRAFT_540845 [Lentinus tigrinus ALCF2SS1-7]RPD70073.1 hypothetical protein L226DRAFT_539315 [Lentinus tigrinus ALCF2SS1-7]
MANAGTWSSRLSSGAEVTHLRRSSSPTTSPSPSPIPSTQHPGLLKDLPFYVRMPHSSASAASVSLPWFVRCEVVYVAESLVQGRCVPSAVQSEKSVA